MYIGDSGCSDLGAGTPCSSLASLCVKSLLNRPGHTHMPSRCLTHSTEAKSRPFWCLPPSHHLFLLGDCDLLELSVVLHTLGPCLLLAVSCGHPQPPTRQSCPGSPPSLASGPGVRMSCTFAPIITNLVFLLLGTWQLQP